MLLPRIERFSEKKKNLVMLDLRSGVVPSDDGDLRGDSGESDEVFSLGHVHRLSVNPR